MGMRVGGVGGSNGMQDMQQVQQMMQDFMDAMQSGDTAKAKDLLKQLLEKLGVSDAGGANATQNAGGGEEPEEGGPEGAEGGQGPCGNKADDGEDSDLIALLKKVLQKLEEGDIEGAKALLQGQPDPATQA